MAGCVGAYWLQALTRIERSGPMSLATKHQGIFARLGTSLAAAALVVALAGYLVVGGLVLINDASTLREIHSPAILDTRNATVIGHRHRLFVPWLPVDRVEVPSTVPYRVTARVVRAPEGPVPVGEQRLIAYRVNEGSSSVVRYADAPVPQAADRFLWTGIAFAVLGLLMLPMAFLRVRGVLSVGEWTHYRRWQIEPPYQDRHGA
jgi:hypothetical protein